MSRSPLLAVGASMLLALAPAPVLAQVAPKKPLTPAERAKVEKAFRDGIGAADAKAALAAAAKVSSLAKRMEPGELEAALREAFPATPKKRLEPGFRHGIEFESGGRTFTYSLHVPPAAAKGRVPLVVDPGHVSLADADEQGVEDVMRTWLSLTGATEDVLYLRTRVFDALENEGVYDEWAKPARNPKEGNSDVMARAVLDAIAHACRTLPVDPDRVVVHGLSMSGYWAWQLCASAPGRFAAIAPVAAVTWHVLPVADTFATERVFVLHGEQDAICPFPQAEAMRAAVAAAGGTIELVAVEDGEHVKNTFPRWRELWPRVAASERERYPRAVARRFAGRACADVSWLVAEDLRETSYDLRRPRRRLTGRIDGQTIEIETEDVPAVRVLLSSAMVDLDQSIEIRVNGASKFRGKPPLDPETTFATAWRRGDGGATYSASVRVVP